MPDDAKIDPELLQKVIELTGLREDAAVNAIREARANKMFNAPAPGGKSYGGRYVALSSIETIAAGLNKYKAGGERDRLQAEGGVLRKQIRSREDQMGKGVVDLKQSGGEDLLINMLLGAKNQQPAPQPQATQQRQPIPQQPQGGQPIARQPMPSPQPERTPGMFNTRSQTADRAPYGNLSPQMLQMLRQQIQQRQQGRR